MAPREAARAPGLGGPALAGIALVALLLRLALLLRPLVEIDDLTLIDDSYLSLHLARSVARGLGPFYETGWTNGFQPLYVFLMAPVYALFPHDAETPVRVAIALLALFDVAGMLVLARLLARVAPSRLACGAALLLWAVNPGVIRIATNGLETSIAFCLVALCLLRLARVQEAPARAGEAREGALFGALLGLAALARVDSLLLAPVAALEWALAAHRARVPAARAARALGVGALVAAAVQLPWLAYSFHWTGTIFPVSGRAVRLLELSNVSRAPTLANFFLPMARHAAEAILRVNVVALGAIVALAAALPFASRGVRANQEVPGGAPALAARLRPAALFALLLVLAYVGFVYGHWHFTRYLFPVAIPVTLALVALLEAHQRAWGGAPAGRIAMAALAALLVLGALAEPPFRKLYRRAPPPMWGYFRIGQWARAHFPPGTRIGGSQTGAIAYFADSLEVVNLDGVVNRRAYEAMRDRRLLDYVREAGVTTLVWQDDIEALERESLPPRRARARLVETVPGFTTLGTPWRIYEVEPAPR